MLCVAASCLLLLLADWCSLCDVCCVAVAVCWLPFVICGVLCVVLSL